MSIAAELLTKTADFDEHRAAQRAPVDLQAGFRKAGYDSARAEISDISVTGCKVDSAVSLGPKTQVWIKFPGLQPMQATVIWTNGFEVGCEFSAPFYKPVLDNLLYRHQAA
jgi:hypothetical protein